jgi:ornithine cyclodeaminase
MIRPGLRIVAIGADSPGKTEIAKDVMIAADLILTDSTQQCLAYGECVAIAPSAQAGTSSIIEIGEVLLGQQEVHLPEDSIAIADLTGLGAQDAAIAELAIKEILAAG